MNVYLCLSPCVYNPCIFPLQMDNGIFSQYSFATEDVVMVVTIRVALPNVAHCFGDVDHPC